MTIGRLYGIQIMEDHFILGGAPDERRPCELAAVGEMACYQTSRHSKFATGRCWRVLSVFGEACCKRPRTHSVCSIPEENKNNQSSYAVQLNVT